MSLPVNTLFFEHIGHHGRMPTLNIFIDPVKFDQIQPLVILHFPRESNYFFQGMDPQFGWTMIECWTEDDPCFVNYAINLANALDIEFVECESCGVPSNATLSPPYWIPKGKTLDVLFTDGTLINIQEVANFEVRATQTGKSEEFFTSVSWALIDNRKAHGKVASWEVK